MATVHFRSMLAALLLCAVLLPACGADDDGSSGDSSTPALTTEERESDDHEDEEGEAHWGYAGDIGPAHWGSLSEEFAACEAGVEQSPIDIEPTDVEGTDIADPVLNWQAGDLELINNGHTIQANVPEGSQSELNGQTYDLIQFHWHRPSEHTVDGDPFAMELHFVHADATGNLAVLGVLLKEGDANPLYDILWEGQPEEGEARRLSDVDFSGLLPGDLTTYVYAGSLTTPPCSEGVAWNVLETPAGISAEQVRAFLFDGNARLVQPVNDRSVEVGQD
jgi:carbonic anhydrase